MEKGTLIAFEGSCDGIGKTTQFDKLSSRLESDGEIITCHHFPTYNTYHGAPVEKYLHGEFGNPRESNPYFVNCLFAVDRAVVWYSNLKKLYDQGNTI